jgi:RNA polymerase-binding transcription factor DksA
MPNRIAERPTGLDSIAGSEPPLLELRERLERLWRQQLDEVTSLTVRLHDTRAALDGKLVDDEAVAAVLTVIERQLELARRELVEHDAALRRFTKGAYGFCRHCGGSIAEDRLAALPTARLCASCQFWSRRA